MMEMKKIIFILAMAVTMICTVSCETVGKGVSADMVADYEN